MDNYFLLIKQKMKYEHGILCLVLLWFYYQHFSIYEDTPLIVSAMNAFY